MNNYPKVVPGGGVEPPRGVTSADFESAASASSAIPARIQFKHIRALSATQQNKRAVSKNEASAAAAL